MEDASDEEDETLIYARWSAKHGEFPAGDPEIHHIAGTLFAQGSEIIWHKQRKVSADTLQTAMSWTRKDTSLLVHQTHP